MEVADGLVTFTAYAVFENTEPAPGPAELNSIDLTFAEDAAGTAVQVAASIRVEKGGWATLPASVSPEYEQAGRKLTGWRLGGSVYAPGQKVTFEELAAIAGGSPAGGGVVSLTLSPVFENAGTPAAPADPEEPADPQAPATPENPAAGGGTTAVSAGKALPKTGAGSPVTPGAAAVPFAAGCGAAIYLYILRRREG